MRNPSTAARPSPSAARGRRGWPDPRRAAAAILAALALLAPGPQAAAEPGAAGGWTLSGEVFHDRDAVDGEDGPLRRAVALHDRLGARLSAERVLALAPGRALSLGLAAARHVYPDLPEADRLLFEGRAELRRDLPGDRRRLSLRLEGTQALDPRARVFSRLRLGAALRVAAGPRRSLQARLRLGWRDQVETEGFTGYDQAEGLAELAWSRRSADRRGYLRAAAYFEGRRAQDAAYSYDEAGARLLVRRGLDPAGRLALRLSAFARGYRAGGREDARLRATLGYERALAGGAALEVHAGYVRNASRLAEKDHAGALFGLRLRLALD